MVRSTDMQLDADRLDAFADGIMMTAGAIGAIAADKYEPSKYRAGMNLQFGMIAAQADDMFLMASDGLWDTLDPVQVTLHGRLIKRLWQRCWKRHAAEPAHVVDGRRGCRDHAAALPRIPCRPMLADTCSWSAYSCTDSLTGWQQGASMALGIALKLDHAVSQCLFLRCRADRRSCYVPAFTWRLPTVPTGATSCSGTPR